MSGLQYPDECPSETTCTDTLTVRLRNRASSIRKLTGQRELFGATSLLLDDAAEAIEERDARLAIVHRHANGWAMVAAVSLMACVALGVVLVGGKVWP